MNTNEQLNKAMFNGRTLHGDFRRGFWTSEQLNTFSGKLPEQVEQLKSKCSNLFYYKGAIALYCANTEQGKVIYVNTHLQNDNIVLALVDLLKNKNQSAQVVFDNTLQGATRAGGSKRDIDLLLAI